MFNMWELNGQEIIFSKCTFRDLDKKISMNAILKYFYSTQENALDL